MNFLRAKIAVLKSCYCSCRYNFLGSELILKRFSRFLRTFCFCQLFCLWLASYLEHFSAQIIAKAVFCLPRASSSVRVFFVSYMLVFFFIMCYDDSLLARFTWTKTRSKNQHWFLSLYNAKFSLIEVSNPHNMTECAILEVTCFKVVEIVLDREKCHLSYYA